MHCVHCHATDNTIKCFYYSRLYYSQFYYEDIPFSTGAISYSKTIRVD